MRHDISSGFLTPLYQLFLSYITQSVEMCNDSSSFGKSSFRMMGSNSVLVRLRRTMFRFGLLSAQSSFRIREYGRQGRRPWAHLVYHLHLVGQGEWMPTVDKMDKIACWESEVLSLERLRQKLEWNQFGCECCRRPQVLGKGSLGEIGSGDLTGLPWDSEWFGQVLPD